MRCGFNSYVTAWTKQMASVSRSLAEMTFTSSLWNIKPGKRTQTLHLQNPTNMRVQILYFS